LNSDAENQSKLIPLSKRLMMRRVLALELKGKSHYFHLYYYHLQEYFDFLAEVSTRVGFSLTLKMLAQDGVESQHK